jgi:hypothetical protein
MSWNRDRFNREDDERDYGNRSRSRQWDRDFDAQSNTQGNFQNQGRGFEGDYGYGRDFDYQRGMSMGNQGRSYGGTDYGRGMGNDFYDRGNYGQQMGPDFGRGNRGDWGQNPNFGYDRQNDWGQGNQGSFNRSFNRDYDYGSSGFQGSYGSQMNQGQLRGGWPRGGDYDYSRNYGGFQEGDWSSSPTRQNFSQGSFGGRGFRSRNWGQGQPDFNRDFGQGLCFGDYDYGQNQGHFGSSYGSSERNFQGRGSFGSQSQGGFGGSNRGFNQGPHSGRGPQGWQRSDDRIREDVNEALSQHGWLDATNVNVDVHNGMVTLTGTVENRYAKRMAEDALENISGVSDVQNNLRVQMGDEGTRARNESFSGTGQSTGTGSTSGTSGRSTSSTGSTSTTTNRTKERSTT